MQDDLDSTDRYLARAEECRVIAGMMTDPRTRRAMLKVSGDYVGMAQTRRNIHATGMVIGIHRSGG